jgi:hypothetical protein
MAYALGLRQIALCPAFQSVFWHALRQGMY